MSATENPWPMLWPCMPDKRTGAQATVCLRACALWQWVQPVTGDSVLEIKYKAYTCVNIACESCTTAVHPEMTTHPHNTRIAPQHTVGYGKSKMLRSCQSARAGTCAGKYTETNLPKGPRGAVINADRVREVQPLLSLMRDIGSAHGGKTPGQVRRADALTHHELLK